jgi:hypothetical protein
MELLTGKAGKEAADCREIVAVGRRAAAASASEREGKGAQVLPAAGVTAEAVST